MQGGNTSLLPPHAGNPCGGQQEGNNLKGSMKNPGLRQERNKPGWTPISKPALEPGEAPLPCPRVRPSLSWALESASCQGNMEMERLELNLSQATPGTQQPKLVPEKQSEVSSRAGLRAEGPT